MQSRFYFDKPGTLGKALGFRNPGAYNSITSWAYTISNKTPYQNDILLDAIGAPISKEVNNYINLNGDNYILMTNPLFKNTVNISNVSNIFAKLFTIYFKKITIFNILLSFYVAIKQFIFIF